MGGIDLFDERAAVYHLDRKSINRFYLPIFSDLMDVACANSYIVYNMNIQMILHCSILKPFFQPT